mgnify:FL=1
MSLTEKKRWLETGDSGLSLRRRSELLGINRSSLYYKPVEPDKEELTLMNLIDEQYTRTPFYGSRRMTAYLRRQDYEINRKRIQGLMQRMGLEAVFPGPNTSRRSQEHRIYPYLLKGLEITRPNQVWSTDITYIRMWRGFLYLVAVMDWYSRYVLAWRISNSLDSVFCVDALEASFQYGMPDIFNSDQGCQFTSQEFTGRLLDRKIAISMDSRGRALDNVFIERLWRSVKYEEVYLNDYQAVEDARGGIGRYFGFYNDVRPHQSLGYRTPQEVYFDGRN